MVSIKDKRDKLYFSIMDEATNTILSLNRGGRSVCGSFRTGRQPYICNNCGYSEYVHLCKRLLKFNLLIGEPRSDKLKRD